MNTLMSVVGYFPHSVYQAYVCSSGAHGYGAFKEALEVGRPRHTLLVTNVDIRTIEPPTSFVPHPPPQPCSISVIYSMRRREPLQLQNIFLSPHLPPSKAADTISTSSSHHNHLTTIGRPTSIVDEFLDGCDWITTIDLAGLTGMIVINCVFLRSCKGLISIDLGPLRRIVEIEQSFLEGCTGLTSIDLTPMVNIRLVRELFLRQCTGITSINLSPLSNLTMIKGWFLESCTGLTSLDCSPLTKVTQIGPSFLAGCTGLTSLCLGSVVGGGGGDVEGTDNGFINVKSIDDSVLFGCTGLTSIDLSPLRRVVFVGEMFLGGCSGLKNIHMEHASPTIQQYPHTVVKSVDTS